MSAMKYVIVRCEDTAPSGQAAPLLEGAKAIYLQQLAQAGAGGLIRSGSSNAPIDRLAIHRGLFGLKANEAAVPPGCCYAASVNLRLAPEESVWCCDFVTQRDGRVVDTGAGHITTKESALLIQALSMELGSDARRWEVGHGSHHLLVTHDASLKADRRVATHSPDLLFGQSWTRSLPKQPVGDALKLIMEQAAELLDRHPVNRVRIDLGENPANLPWLWGAADATTQPSLNERTGLSAALLSNDFALRGFARALHIDWAQGAASMEEQPLQRLAREVVRLSSGHDLVYAHLQVDNADPVERLCAIDRMDQLLLKPLAEQLSRTGDWRLLVAIDDRAEQVVPFVAIGSGLPRQPVAHARTAELAGSPLLFSESADLFAWFTAGNRPT